MCDRCDHPECDGCLGECHECGCEDCHGGCQRDEDEADDCLNCGMCQECIDRSIAAEESESNDRDRFIQHLERASAIARTWPAWKRNIFGSHLD